MLELLAVIIGIATVVVMVVLALHTVINNVPLDTQWGVLIIGVFSLVLGLERAKKTLAKKAHDIVESTKEKEDSHG